MSIKDFGLKVKEFSFKYKKEAVFMLIGAAVAVGVSFVADGTHWKKDQYSQMWLGCNLNLYNEGIPIGMGFKFCDCLLDKFEKKLTVEQVLNSHDDDEILAKERDISISCQNKIGN